MKKTGSISVNRGVVAFLAGFLLFILIILPDLIINNCVIYGSGDYNNQTFPFIYHIRDTLLTGENLVWDHASGIGAQFLSSYAYYNLFSPFSFLYLLVPHNFVAAAIPFVNAVKFGTGSMLAYFYLRRYLKSADYAVIGGLLYAFSSFNGYNLVYHFADITMLFPVLLISMDMLCLDGKKGAFALSVALMAVVNYYFFFGQAVFCVIYFFIRCADKELVHTLKKLPLVIIEALLGIGLSMAVLMPVIMTLLQSSKATGLINFEDMFFYDHIFRYLKIMQSAFMIPDHFYFTSLFPEKENVYPLGTMGSSTAAYIPLFSAAGVISYIVKKRKSWASYLLVLCTVMTFIPVLNQSFSLFNSAFYTRWYYMPMLIGIMVSLKALEESISFKPGIITCGAVLGVFIVWQFFVDEDFIVKNGITYTTYSMPQNIIHFAVTVIMLIMLIIIVKSKRDKEFVPKLYIFAVISCYMTFGVMANYFLTSYGYSDKNFLIERMNITEKLPEEMDTDARIATKYAIRNFNLMWGLDSVAYFNSLADPGFAEFLKDSDLMAERGVYRTIISENNELVDLLSVRYFIVSDDSLDKTDNVTMISPYGDYFIYENNDYIPMGFTYDYMISAERFSEITDTAAKHRAYIKYLVVENPEEFSDIIVPDDENAGTAITAEEYSSLIERHKKEACYDLEKNNDGISAKIDLSAENIVFFSISHNDSWKAFVDGEETEVYKVNNGMIGVRVPEGTHEIQLVYTVKGLAAGIVISCLSAAAIIVYIFIFRRKEKKNVSQN